MAGKRQGGSWRESKEEALGLGKRGAGFGLPGAGAAAKAGDGSGLHRQSADGFFGSDLEEASDILGET